MAATKKASDDQDNTPKVDDPGLEQGFRGVEVDETPNVNYTAAGVTSGKPTPETKAG